MAEDTINQITPTTPAAVSGNRRGRPKFKPNAEQRRVVAIMASGGLPQKEIASHFRISLPTLCRYFREELHAAADTDVVDDKAPLPVKRRTVAEAIYRDKLRQPRP
jgi:hypothetical protein